MREPRFVWSTKKRSRAASERILASTKMGPERGRVIFFSCFILALPSGHVDDLALYGPREQCKPDKERALARMCAEHAPEIASQRENEGLAEAKAENYAAVSSS